MEKKSILVLYQHDPELIRYEGGLATDELDFEMTANTEAFRTCSATINGEFYILGGSTSRRQVFML